MLLVYEVAYDVPVSALFAGWKLGVSVEMSHRAEQRYEEIEAGYVDQTDFDERLEALGRIKDLSSLTLR